MGILCQKLTSCYGLLVSVFFYAYDQVKTTFEIHMKEVCDLCDATSQIGKEAYKINLP